MLLEPLKSKLDRFERLQKEIESAYVLLKAERLRNLELLPADQRDLIKTGRIPGLKSLLDGLAGGLASWSDLRGQVIPLLKEMRFLGAPKRKAVSDALIAAMGRLYSRFKDEKELVDALVDLLAYEQMNPLILEDDKGQLDQNDESYLTVLHTAQDLYIKLEK